MASTVIGAGITIEGEVTSDDDVVVQGTIRGKLLTKEAVTVEQGGVVEADIASGPLTVAGAVTGNITSSDRVDLQAGAKVRGDIHGESVAIDDGAEYVGRLDAQFELPPELGGSSSGGRSARR